MNYLADFFIFNLLESTNSSDIKFIKQPKKKDAKTDIYNISKNNIVIGQIKWSSRMRGYSFLPTKDCEDIIKDFIKELMAKRRKNN